MSNTKTVITTSWDDGTKWDLKLLKLLRKYEIPATFYIPTNQSIGTPLSPSKIKEISEEFDVGGHTENHKNLTTLPLDKIQDEVRKNKKWLEKITGKRISSFCYPNGMYTKFIIEVVKGFGFKGARTTRILEFNVKNPFEMGTSIVANPWQISYFKKLFKVGTIASLKFLLRNKLLLKDWEEVASFTLKYTVKTGGVWHLWGHSWEIEMNNDWEKLERIFKILKDYSTTHNNIKLVSNTDIFSKSLK